MYTDIRSTFASHAREFRGFSGILAMPDSPHCTPLRYNAPTCGQLANTPTRVNVYCLDTS